MPCLLSTCEDLKKVEGNTAWSANAHKICSQSEILEDLKKIWIHGSALLHRWLSHALNGLPLIAKAQNQITSRFVSNVDGVRDK